MLLMNNKKRRVKNAFTRLFFHLISQWICFNPVNCSP